jgi:hypothetical protein
MTFYRGLCEDVFEARGRDGVLRQAYRVYIWRRARGLVVHRSLLDVEAGAELLSEIQAVRWSKGSNELDVEEARRM